ncbi:MAG: nucleotidyltransferase [Chloroflexi bacterium]|nr:nucleotidyltransferase [Chloroflexota bacterium]
MFNQDFKEFLQSLNENDVKYLVVGGYAVAAHGHPRYTKDLDVWIENTPQNAGKMVKALAAFGFGGLNLTADDFSQPDTIIQLGYPPNRIDILTTLPGIGFADCFESRVRIEIEDVQVNFIDIDNLIRNKRATGRTQDLADAETLENH